jgi:hypothetical protein
MNFLLIFVSRRRIQESVVYAVAALRGIVFRIPTWADLGWLNSPREERPEIELTTTPYISEVAHYLCPLRNDFVACTSEIKFPLFYASF